MQLSERIQEHPSCVALSGTDRDLWKRLAAQLEAENYDLFTKLLSSEELYISRGMKIAKLEIEIARIRLVAQNYLDNPKLGARDNLEDALTEAEDARSSE